MRAHLLVPIFAAALAAPRLAHAGGVRHLPPAEATAGSPLELSADVARASERTLYLRYRPLGATTWSQIEFSRDRTAGDHWIATVPASEVAPPGLEYFIASRDETGGATTPEDAEFASAELPHLIGVHASERDQRRARDLVRAEHRRSRVRVSSELVSFGPRHLNDATVQDGYYRVDADFGYKLLTYPLEEIRFGYTRLEGDVPNSGRELPRECATSTSDPLCKLDAGFKVGGWFELGLGLAEGIRLDARGMFMANQEGFAVGARAELRAGVADGNHVAIGTEYLASVGATGFFRLGWDTVPSIPMATTIEVTNMPASVRATGVRLLYDAFYPFPNGLRLGARIGYAARDQRVGGPTAGLSASLDF